MKNGKKEMFYVLGSDELEDACIDDVTEKARSLDSALKATQIELSGDSYGDGASLLIVRVVAKVIKRIPKINPDYKLEKF